MRLRALFGPGSSPLGYFAIVAFLMSAPAAAHITTTPTGAGTLYDAGFDGLASGAALPVDSSGASSELPSSMDTNLTATVEDSTTVPAGTPALNSTKFARLRESCGEAPNLTFDRGVALGTTASPNALVHVAVDVLFENLENYSIFFRNGAGSGIPGPSSQTVADIDTTAAGSMSFSSLGGTTSVTYRAGVPYHIDAFFDLGNDRWYVFVNGSRVVNGTSILASPLGRVGIGFNFSSFCPPVAGASFRGVMQFDNFVFREVGAIPTVAPDPSLASILPGVGRPYGVAVHQGYAYVADPEAHTVWKINFGDPANKIPVAGIGWKTDVDPQDRQGYNGDGIESTEAQLDNPSGVAIDASGNIYIADTGNHAIRKIAAGASFITTVAGIPTSYAVGESTPLPCLDPPSGFDMTQCVTATSLRLFGPRALAIDAAGNVYIADRMNQQVKKLHTSGTTAGFITVVAGVAGYTGGNDGPVVGPTFCPPGTEFCDVAARLNSPVGVAVDGEGIVYVADEGNNAIRKVTLGGNVSTVPASGLLRPTGVAATSDGGTLYIADYGNHRIQRATDCATSCALTTIVGTGTPGSSGAVGAPATSVQLNSPIAVLLNGLSLFIADMLNGRVLEIDLNPPPVIF